jgi:hypothetical protein
MGHASISHAWSDETPEAKALWFQSLPLAERMELLCHFTELILAVTPHIVEQRDVEPPQGRVRVIAAP